MSIARFTYPRSLAVAFHGRSSSSSYSTGVCFKDQTASHDARIAPFKPVKFYKPQPFFLTYPQLQLSSSPSPTLRVDPETTMRNRSSALSFFFICYTTFYRFQIVHR